ncbi:hypothetical protein [Rathayibacter festucae]|uniref:Uncharacterized protein n=1 Tax=Rathayibacter festucae DSM 15932 TaxID=1328866 RepID=A0A3Q9UXI1_9MICO|nr:hypothetical protein [Rathayibacter festucae]AZZ51464.1 hypothetical protein C1I64_05015 [Rathayibacter festucae DSM 15932]
MSRSPAASSRRTREPDRALVRALSGVPAGTLAVGLVLSLAGCAGLAPDAAAAGATAAAFEEALAAGDGAAACAVLTPRAAEAVVETGAGSTACPDAILALGLDPASAGSPRAEAFGQAAVVALGGDTVFLAASGDGWRVRAAGCTATGEDLPFDCAIDGS